MNQEPRRRKHHPAMFVQLLFGGLLSVGVYLAVQTLDVSTYNATLITGAFVAFIAIIAFYGG